jgi:hypothetical protein
MKSMENVVRFESHAAADEVAALFDMRLSPKSAFASPSN